MKYKLPFYGYLGLAFLIFSFVLTFLFKEINLTNVAFLDRLWMPIFALGLFLFSISLNSNSEKSFFNLIKYRHYKEAIIIMLYSIIVGAIYDVIGILIFKFWNYHLLVINPYFYFIIAICWAFFGVIVHELFLFLNRFFNSLLIKTILIGLFVIIIMEGLNLITQSWFYAPVHPLLFFFGWMILVFTFYPLPQKLKIFS